MHLPNLVGICRTKTKTRTKIKIKKYINSNNWIEIHYAGFYSSTLFNKRQLLFFSFCLNIYPITERTYHNLYKNKRSSTKKQQFEKYHRCKNTVEERFAFFLFCEIKYRKLQRKNFIISKDVGNGFLLKTRKKILLNEIFILRKLISFPFVFIKRLV